MSSLVGRRIGRVRITALLGSGGTGEVYRGHDEVLGRTVAVKRLREESRFRPEAKARLLREAKILARLEHPAICRLYDLVESGGEELLLLELVEGRSLRDPATAGLGFEDKLGIAHGIADALAAAHAAGVVHRDLKPDNVMLTASGEVKVLDFGIARSLGDPPDELAGASGPAALATAAEAVTRIGSVVGTPGYMSPEQERGLPASAASDLFSLGVLLEDLFHRRPDVERSSGERRSARHRELAELLAALRSSVPSQRPDAAETARRLAELRRRPQRRRRLALLALAGCLVLSLVGGAAWLAASMARPPPLIPAGEQGQLLLLPFRNATGDAELDWVELGLWELVRGTFEDVDGVQLVPWEPARDGAPPEEIARQAGPLARATGATFLVDTTVARRDGGFEIGSVIFAGGEEIDRGTVVAPDPLTAADLLTDRLRRRLVEQAPRVALADRYSGDAFVNRLYALGLQRIETDPAAARPYLLAALDLDPRFERARLGLARIDERLARWPEAAAQAATVLKSARAAGDRRLEAAAAALAADAAIHYEPFDVAVERARTALDLHRALDDRAGSARDLERLGQLHWEHARLTDDGSSGRRAEQLFDQAAALRRRLGDRRSLAYANYYLALNDAATGQIERARRRLDAALALASEAHQPRAEALILNSQANLAFDAGEPRLALRLYHRSLALHRRIDNPVGVSTVLGNLGKLAADSGRWHRARALYTESAEAARTVGARDRLADALYRLAWADIVLDDVDGATSALAERRSLLGTGWDQLPIEARAAALQGDFQSASRLMERAREAAGDSWRPHWEDALASYRAGQVPSYEILDAPPSPHPRP